MKYTKKAISISMSIMLIIITVLPIIASAASCNISASSASGKQGDIITINVNISNVALGSFKFDLNYDNSKLEFQSVSKGPAATSLENSTANSTGASQIRCTASTSEIENTNVSGSVMSVKFKIIASSGSAGLSVSGNAFEASGARISTSFSGGSVTINAGGNPVTQPPEIPVNPVTPPDDKKSSNANLKSLAVQGKTTDGKTVQVAISPSFSPSVTTYNANIAGDVEKLVVSASAEDKKAKVLPISNGYLKMDEGNNTTVITVKAENGTTKKYTIKTIKATGGTSPAEINPELTTTSAETTSSVTEEATSEPTTVLSSTDLTTENTTDAFGKNIIDKVSNDFYIKLGVGFAVLSVIFFGVSICALISKNKRKSGGEDE
ncbi:MAG: cohesin domain-containing protein [Oscillospiraceae bacterium]